MKTNQVHQGNQTLESNAIRSASVPTVAAGLTSATGGHSATCLALCALAALLALPLGLRAAATETARSSQPIAWSGLGAKATAQYSGYGVAVYAAEDGALRRMRGWRWHNLSPMRFN